ncbi:uncharacterized protein LOC124918988 [Impatiens glandulifera]|uniref:uncharacterized protein LOC124918988 n=1 Tax=Impatiens glandulifera TaxID=253017 RepID=UPI001FB1755F|nr:uncharacterized protein LOC124918988 [Impatiens glandulifera]
MQRFMNPPRPAAASRKRKERSDSILQIKPPPLQSVQTAASSNGDVSSSSTASNRLLAGYMAYEFLKSGTVLGQKWDPASRDKAEKEQPRWQTQQSYADVARLMKDDEAHVAGVVNPSQLARWIQM